MTDQFVSISIEDLFIGEPLPVSLYVYLNFRFVTFRAAGDAIDRVTYDKLEFNKVRYLFIADRERAKFAEWASKRATETAAPALPPENQGFAVAREDAHRRLHDIFIAEHPDRVVVQAMEASKKLVDEVMKFPYAVQTLALLQSYSKGTVDHSVNVSTLSVYLALQMGYAHTVILQHVSAGGLLHDVGKSRIRLEESDSPETVQQKMLEHPTVGMRLLDSQAKVPNEVKLIVAQHHECNDGSGYPKKLRGGAIYDLAKIVSIANVFDELVADGKGSLQERQRDAIVQLDQVLYRKFDPQKLDKALKILKMGV